MKMLVQRTREENNRTRGEESFCTDHSMKVVCSVLRVTAACCVLPIACCVLVLRVGVAQAHHDALRARKYDKHQLVLNAYSFLYYISFHLPTDH